uniref:Uncharacterized protein n=1 Tax=Roseihalotalea indica TaxID=2867963 RepID=A0AA49JHB2_9BACT|nr:hypothetical protein K4G66_08485 [Tunicatimonas sp. TK19036]
MRSLDDPIWQKLTGGYHTSYDASLVLKKLEAFDKEKEEEPIWDEIWSELYHQGDIGTASFLSVPQLIRIYQNKGKINYQVFAFITAVELTRIKNSLTIPDEFKHEYEKAINQIPELVSLAKQQSWDSLLAASVLSAIAVWKKRYRMAELISELEDEELTEYLLKQINEY